MLITVVGTKGSQGKSTISHAIAYEKGFGIITNDIDSSVDEFLPEERVVKLRNDDELPESLKHEIDLFFVQNKKRERTSSWSRPFEST